MVSNTNTLIANNGGATGTVTVTGAGSQLNNTGAAYVGSSGQGTLTIQNGGVANNVNTNIGYSGAVGAVTVTGAGSQLNNTGAVYVGGVGGQGTLTIQDGGVVNNTNTNIAYSGGIGAVTVTGAGSQLNNSGAAYGGGVGGQGTLAIQDGGVANNTNTNIAYSGGVGAVTVTGRGSQLNNTGAVLIGVNGQGTLTIQSGGSVSDVNATVGAASGSTGSVLLDAGTWTSTGSLEIGVSGTGTVTIQDDGNLTAGTITVGSSGSLFVDPATVDVTGDFTLDSGGLLSLDIAGTAPGSFSELDITGDGLFDGTADLDFIDGFAPLAGETFDLINATGGADLSTATFEIEGLEPGFDYTIDNGVLTASNNGVSDTPEPNAGWLLAGALSCLLAAGASRKRCWSEGSRGLDT